MKRTFSIALVIAGLIGPFQLASAQTVMLSNLAQPQTLTYGSNRSDLSGSQYYASFTTGPGLSYQLDSITMALLTGGTGISFQLLPDNPAYAGLGYPITADTVNPLATLLGPSSTSANGTYAYTTASTVILMPNTTYWIFGVEPSVLYAGWSAPATGTTTDVQNGGWAYGQFYAQSIGGSSSGFIPSTELQFSVTATAIPEADNFAEFLGLAVLGLVIVRRRLQS